MTIIVYIPHIYSFITPRFYRSNFFRSSPLTVRKINMHPLNISPTGRGDIIETVFVEIGAFHGTDFADIDRHSFIYPGAISPSPIYSDAPWFYHSSGQIDISVCVEISGADSAIFATVRRSHLRTPSNHPFGTSPNEQAKHEEN
jgi:hypothetical protein